MNASPESDDALAKLTVRPIGFLRAGKQVKFQTRHQPDETSTEENVLELLPGRGFDLGLRDLSGFSRIWLVSWFDRNESWRALVLPPRGPARRRGVFATRSPHRPNPLGLTPVQLKAIRGRRLFLGPCDLMDGTPILDIKPYIPSYDAFPDEQTGWIEAVDRTLQEPPRFTVTFAALAEEQADWLRERWQVDFRPRLIELLSQDPSVHRGRRIRARGAAMRVAGCGAWRAVFAVAGQAVEVRHLEAAYPRRFLEDPQRLAIADREAQRAFLERWPEQTISGG
ncbi:MAG: tRNA (N6-threonylcarbamoyladenosine(37)-N6)-methyltransferase TrmO [Verrucomicrobia bacterium]|nr:tRNA (N6-threonylcarbamoyladenosine(37)-N6)-methyltransferase TrmO [Verrucomicrobiota bacterium]